MQNCKPDKIYVQKEVGRFGDDWFRVRSLQQSIADILFTERGFCLSRPGSQAAWNRSIMIDVVLGIDLKIVWVYYMTVMQYCKQDKIYIQKEVGSRRDDGFWTRPLQ